MATLTGLNRFQAAQIVSSSTSLSLFFFLGAYSSRRENIHDKFLAALEHEMNEIYFNVR